MDKYRDSSDDIALK